MRLRKDVSPGGKREKKDRRNNRQDREEELLLQSKRKVADEQSTAANQCSQPPLADGNRGCLSMYQLARVDFLRQAVEQGLPPNIFEFAAQKILKYEKLMKLKQAKKHELEEYNKSLVGNHNNTNPKHNPP